jgi:hypothetical protein
MVRHFLKTIPGKTLLRGECSSLFGLIVRQLYEVDTRSDNSGAVLTFFRPRVELAALAKIKRMIIIRMICNTNGQSFRS